MSREPQTVHKTYKTYQYKLTPAPQQEQLLDRTLLLCRHVYNAAIGERQAAWRMRGVSVTSYQQKAELPGVKEAMPDYGEVHSQALPEVILRVDRAFQAFFQRIGEGQTPGYPRFHGSTRYNSYTSYTSFTYPQFENGVRLDNGFLVLSKIGRIAVRWSRPIEGAPKTVTICREADGWYVAISCADVPVQPLPATGQETGIDLDIEAFATVSKGTRIFTPGWDRKAERALKTAQRRVARRKRGSNRRRKAVTLLANAHHKVRRQRTDFHHKVALRLLRENDAIYHENLQPANRVKGHHLAKSINDAGWGAFLIILGHKAACAGRRRVGVSTPPSPHNGVAGVAWWSIKVCPSAGTLARTVEPACTVTTTPPETENGSGRAVGERWRRLPRRTENPLLGSVNTILCRRVEYNTPSASSQ
jgi:putative transposase